jgi:hypothetical protein
MTSTVSRLSALAGGALLVAGLCAPALAQKPVGNDPVPSILTWTPSERLERYPSIEKFYEVATIKKGDKPRELAVASSQIAPTVSLAGKSSSLDSFMTTNRIAGVVAIKDGQVVLEKYALGHSAEARWPVPANPFVSTLVGAAVKDRWIRTPYDALVHFLPDLKGSAYDGVSLRQAMLMTSGVKWSEDYVNARSDVRRIDLEPDRPGLEISRVLYAAKLPRENKPGDKFAYKSIDADLAGLALWRALAGKSLAQYASEKIWAPFGMEHDALWMVDNGGHERGGGLISMSLRDYARFGLFVLGGGKIGETEVLPEGWVDTATANRLNPGVAGSHGYLWQPVEEGGYRASGLFSQGLYVYPDENLLVAIHSATGPADRTHTQALDAIVKAVRDTVSNPRDA